MSRIWSDLAVWRGPTVNRYPGGMREVRGLMLHIQQGTQEGSIAWCLNPASQVSAHFFVSKGGDVAQLVDLGDAAWAEVDGNPYWISVECEGLSGQSLTPAQVDACARLFARVHEVYGVPLQISDDPYTVPGISGHGLGGAGYGGHYDCPGTPVLDQRGQIITRAAALVAGQGGPMSLTQADLDAISLIVWGYKNPKLDQVDMRQRLVNAEESAAQALAGVKAIRAKLGA